MLTSIAQVCLWIGTVSQVTDVAFELLFDFNLS